MPAAGPVLYIALLDIALYDSVVRKKTPTFLIVLPIVRSTYLIALLKHVKRRDALSSTNIRLVDE
jgi:hypothetical protein